MLHDVQVLLVAGAPAGGRVRGGMDTDGVIRRIGPSQAAGLRSGSWTGAVTPHHVRLVGNRRVASNGG